MTTTEVIDQETGEVAQSPLKRGELVGTQGLRNLQAKRGPSDIAVSSNRGGVRFTSAQQMIDMAMLLSTADKAVPKHLRANPGACLRIVMQADEWGFSPFAVADQSYEVNDRIAYQSQMLHAVIERHAPLRERLSFRYVGEGTDLTCTVIGHLLGEEKPREWESPKIKDIKVKNSPMWTADPRKQLFYYASRDWARIYCPDVLLGVYSRDEIGEDYRSERIRDAEASGTLADRLPKDHDGFDSDGIATQLRSTIGAPAEPAGEVSGKADDTAAQTETTSGEPALVGEPTNEAEYIVHFGRWLAKMPNRDEAMARWDGDRELRADCKMTVKGRKILEKELAAKFAVQS